MTIHWKQVKKYKFLQQLLIGQGHLLLSICQSTWFVKLVSWLGRKGFWHFQNICSWCQEQKIMLALQGIFINKSVCYSVTWRSYTSHTRRRFSNTKLGGQSFVNSDLSGALPSPHLVLIMHVCVLSTKTQN